MSKLQIIYTPETDHSRLSDTGIWGWKQPGDPSTQRLRVNYQKLRENFQNLPLKVGIVTYNTLFKEESGRLLAEIEDPTTTYMPLDILKCAVDLRNEDTNDAISREYALRTLRHLLTHHSIMFDDNLSARKEILFASMIPLAKEALGILQESAGKTDSEIESKFASLSDKIISTIKGNYPTNYNQLEVVYQEVVRKFEANKVSKDFPLYFLPSPYTPVLYSVSLVDEIETPEYIPEILKILELGCKASGLNKIPDDMKKRVMAGQKDKFGETIRLLQLEELLKILPEPKTLITDLYIVDQFPEIAKIGFEAQEFKLDSIAKS